MADGLNVTQGVGTRILTDEVAYSGDTVHLQGIGIFTVAGAEGSKIATAVSAANPLPARAPGAVSVLNSTTTVLDSDQTFVGAGWDDGLDFGALTVSVATDAASAAGGLLIEQSPDSDGAHVTYATALSVTGGVLTNGWRIPLYARYFRVSLTNGPVAQTALALAVTKKIGISNPEPTTGALPMAQSQSIVFASNHGNIDINQLAFLEDSITVYGAQYNVVTLLVTASGNTTLVTAPAAGFQHIVKAIQYTRADTGGAAITATIRPGGSGVQIFPEVLAAAGARGGDLMPDTEYPIAAATAIIANLSAAAGSGGIYFTCKYTTRVVAA